MEETRPLFQEPLEGAAPEEGDAPPEGGYSTGILPAQDLLRATHVTREIRPREPILDDQIQPASLDLRLGPKAYRVRASFLPGSHSSVQAKLDEFSMHEMDITAGGVLERGCVYIIPLLETLHLKHRMSARGNPKSSTGRLDVFTRLITDYGTEFDQVREGYKGMLYAEVSPRTFSILVRKGSRLSQLRIRRGAPPNSDERHKQLHKEFRLVDRDLSDEEIRNGVPITVDVVGDAHPEHVIGYRAKNHAGLIDVDRVNYYDYRDFWDPVRAPGRYGLVLDPANFYILASREAVKVPPRLAAEMIAYDTLVGEFRVHYAGFFDPGFGDPSAGGEGAKAVLEVRSYEVPFVIEDGQVVGRLVYERLTDSPERLYGSGVVSNYQRQGLRLSKHFRQPEWPRT
ncbi:MAG TPA: 2'-deoxycytidine 5'-triphosphate deaminase [Steroidobacteraceae bacterium]|nr:2'-deoxycytidine 5'-triphosphate deaminase [Steroidobacteraceae bacterium]